MKRLGMYAHFDGMTWPVTGLDLNDLEWRLRYANAGGGDSQRKRDVLAAAGIISAYRALLFLPRRELNKRVTELKRAARLGDSKHSALGAGAGQGPKESDPETEGL